MNLLTKPFGQKISICEAVRRSFIEMPSEFYATDFIQAVRRKIHNYPLDSTILRELRSMRDRGYNWECIDKQKAKYKKIC